MDDRDDGDRRAGDLPGYGDPGASDDPAGRDEGDAATGGDAESARVRDDAGGGTRHDAVTDGVRIAAVEAAVAAGLAPSTGRRHDARPGGGGADAGAAAEARSAPLELPDWTDPPTGQVPRVLLGEPGQDAPEGDGSTVRGPTWREDRSDWDQDIDLSFLVGDGEPVGMAGSAPAGGTDDDPFDFTFMGLTAPPSRRSEAPPAPTAGVASSLAPAGPGAPPGGLDAAAGEPDDLDDEAWAQLLDSSVPPREGEIERLAPRRGSRRSRSRSGHRHRSAGHETPGEPRAGARVAPGGDPQRPAGRPGTQGRSPVLATVTGVVAGAVALACFLAGAVPSLVLVTVLVTLAAGEAFGALRSSGRQPATLLGLVAVPALVVGAYLRGPQAVPFVLGLAVLLGFCWYLAEHLRPGDRRHRPVTNLGATLLVVVWVGLLGAFAGLLLAPATFPHGHGVAFLAGTALLTVAADVGAYAVGAKLGRHPLAPRVSPHKSWEGFVGGSVLVLVVAALVVARIHPFTLSHALLLGAVVVVLAPLGDLAESLVKRDLGVKDMGSLLPAHGGVLDRVDAMLFVLPVAYYLLRLVHPS